MPMYDFMIHTIETQFTVTKTLKEGPRGKVLLLRHRQTGKPYIFRHFTGDGDVYHKLLSISCPNLPQVMEVTERDGEVAVLEEYIQGDTVAGLLEGRCSRRARCGRL